MWNMPGMDFILGLPDITRNFVDLLTSMLRVTTNEVSSVELETEMRPGDIMQWSTGEVEESPEEEHTPVPVAFGPVLAFMETSYEEARVEYCEGSCRRSSRYLSRVYGNLTVQLVRGPLCTQEVDRHQRFPSSGSPGEGRLPSLSQGPVTAS